MPASDKDMHPHRCQNIAGMARSYETMASIFMTVRSKKPSDC